MAKQNESKLWAFLAYLLGIIGFVLVFVLKKNDKFAMYHAKQSLVLFLTATILVAISGVLTASVIGAVIGVPLGMVTWAGFIILSVFGIINALTGQMKPLWLIGKYADKINF